MKTSLNLRQAATQTLTMTPQLQQAIRLLQLSTTELAVEIQENLDKNPLLEVDESSSETNLESIEAMAEMENRNEANYDDFNPFNNDTTLSQDDSPYTSTSRSVDEDPKSLTENFDPNDTISHDTVSQEPPENNDIWADNYSASISSKKAAFDNENDLYEGETSYGLKEHLMWQLNLTPCSEKDKYIATVIIDAVDDSGYLTETIDDILRASQIEFEDTEEDEIIAVLRLVQHFDPIGVASRNVQESLQIQLSQFDKKDPIVEYANTIVKDYIDILGNKDFKTLAKKLNIKDETILKKSVDLIKSLEPRPGNSIITTKSEFIVPDVAVVKRNGEWVAELNPAAIPKLKINETYSALCQSATNASDTQYIKSHMQEANWFIQSLNKRNDTLLKVANCIVKQQQNFFEHGEKGMKPMILNDIATEVEMHESTVSRVTTEKYMYTPRGTFELKYFFSSHVNTDNGGEFSSTAIRAMIKSLISTESTKKPLSDNQLSEMLKEKGIIVARRTVAKYRESLNIPPSSQRKSLT